MSTSDGAARVLIVDDEPNVRRSLQGILQDEGFEVETASSGEECLGLFDRRSFDAVFLDIWLPGRDGMEVLKQIKDRRPGQSVIMISGHGTIEAAVRSTKLGAFDFIEKPLTLEKVLLVLQHALRLQRLEEENRSLKDLVRRQTVMIGSSVPMQALRQQIDYAAPTEARVLIYGENGTGKELVARLLHLKSARHNKPFVEVNCAAIPDDLIESELFGSSKGAYTGATEERQGKFAAADRGTIFLDEVGDMSLKSQAKVLRVLEEQRFYPVGSNEAVKVNVRTIAATNQDLEERIQSGDFREDLFFRLNVIPFQVPALRERLEDIPELYDYFMDRYSRRYGRPPKPATTEALARMRGYGWPGNVRELKNMVERLAIMHREDQVQARDLPRSVRWNREKPEPADPQTLQQAREAFERRFIEGKLQENGGNISRTAAAIGLQRSHLHRKMKALKVRA